MDELGQPNESTLYQSLLRINSNGAAMFGGIGDCHQLPPMTSCEGDVGRLLSMSLPQRMESNNILTNPRVTMGYRMHPILNNFVSHQTYDDELIPAVTADDRRMLAEFPLVHKDVPIVVICVPGLV